MKTRLFRLALMALGLMLGGLAHADDMVLDMIWKPGLCAAARLDASVVPAGQDTPDKSLCADTAQPAGPYLHRNLVIGVFGAHADPCPPGDLENLRLPPIVGPEWNPTRPAGQIWRTHGQCSGMTPKLYFQQGSLMTLQIGRSAFGRYLDRHAGQRVPLAELMRQLKSGVDLGAGRRAPELYCEAGALTHIRFFPPDLSALLDPAPAGPARPPQQRGCEAQVQL